MDGFASETVDLDGVSIRCMRGGSGAPLVLVHGFPQDWYEWRAVMPRLAERFEVIAVDLRGVGASSAPADGYDAATLAGDVRGLLEGLGHGSAHVVGHDIGGWVAYAYARRYPEATRTALVLETLIAGVEPFFDPGVDVPLWHGAFHMVPDLPEQLVGGREAIYFKYFFDVGTVGEDVITAADIEHYAAAYGTPDRLHAAFEVYRAIPANIAFNAEHTGPIDVPLLLVGGEHVFGAPMVRTAETLRASFGWSDVRAEVIPGGRHYLAEERPDDVAALIEHHAR